MALFRAVMAGMSNWQQWVELAPLTTFGLPARARWYVEARDEASALAALQEGEARQLPVLVLGGGSNMVLTRDYPGLVLRMALRGIRHEELDGHTCVTAAAGEPWHELVMHTLQAGVYGLESLALIPGTVGAAPMQNIGAYGVELKDVLHSVRAWDRQLRQMVVLQREQCQFAYRDSLFKRQPGRYLILEVNLLLSRQAQAKIKYADIQAELDQRGISVPTPLQVAQAVIAIRSRKLPDPAQWGNAGSFFKNPIVSREQAEQLLQEFPGAPHWTMADGGVKLAAGWLIQQCGWRGFSRGPVGVYEHQALVLINRGGATGAQIMQLAHEVADSVQQRFGLQLEAEPLVL